MKKMLSFLLTLLMLLGTSPAMADGLYEPMPAEIAALFEVPAWEEYEVMNWLWSEEQNAAVVVMTNDDLHIVCIVEPDKKGNMRITQRNYTIVTTPDAPYISESYAPTAQEIDTPWGHKRLFELHLNGYMVSFGKFDGVWRIKVVLNGKDDIISFVFDDRIGYREGEDMEEYIDWEHNRMKYAYGTYDNRFAAFNIYAFPKTYEEASEALTNPPVTPTDFYTPISVTLRPREKYDVFAAPGRDSYRAANGKAVMSTNDWVQIFGEEDGWVLVQYDISRDQMRFGYVDASVLPRDTEVQTLHWYDLPEQTVKVNINVTDDPLVSRSIIGYLNAGDTVKVLSEFGSWYYIEMTNSQGETLRGFIPQTSIDLITWDDMKG